MVTYANGVCVSDRFAMAIQTLRDNNVKVARLCDCHDGPMTYNYSIVLPNGTEKDASWLTVCQWAELLTK